MQKEEKQFGISGSTLKMLAVITMFIDHTGAGIIGRFLSMGYIGQLEMNHAGGISRRIAQYENLYEIYAVMRMIGRFGFPIFCFLLVEGFEHTHSRMKYAIRLFVFALISEIPFDLLFNGELLEFTYQNVFFTLFVGMLTMWLFSFIKEQLNVNDIFKILLYIAAFLAGMLGAHFLQTDYAARGVFCIMMLYIFRKEKLYQMIAGFFAFSWEMPASFAFLPAAFYNGKRGWNIKYVFYLFYPVHLLVLYLISMAFGVAGYPAM